MFSFTGDIDPSPPPIGSSGSDFNTILLFEVFDGWVRGTGRKEFSSSLLGSLYSYGPVRRLFLLPMSSVTVLPISLASSSEGDIAKNKIVYSIRAMSID